MENNHHEESIRNIEVFGIWYEEDPITNEFSVDYMCWFNMNEDEDEELAREEHGTHEDYWLSLDNMEPGDAIWSDNCPFAVTW